MATNYDVNYDDKRFAEVESDKKAALNEVDQMYGGMINDTDQYYKAQIDAAKDWEKEQTRIQNEQTDFAIEQIEQQKEQAKKDYTKEQSGAYVDWQKQSNQYGANAEQAAAQGMAGTGYSESSQVSMYNTYQNRLATAREAYNRAVLNYDNAIKDARLQNNAALAEIAYQALQTELTLGLEGFQYKNSLIMAQADKKMQIDESYYGRWRDVLTQINTENALAEDVRQFDASMAEEQRQFNAQMAEEQRQFNAQMAYKQSSSGGSGGGSKKSGSVKKSGGSKSSKSGGGSISNNKNTKTVKPNSGQTDEEKNKSKDKEKSKATPSMKSILDLGYGPISAKNLDNKIRQGIVEEYVSGNKLKYRKVLR